MLIDSFAGAVWADWELVTVGEGDDEIIGEFDFVGLDGDRVNDVTPGGAVVVNGATVIVDTLVEVFGIETGTGNVVSYRVQANGTGDVAVPGLWDEIHGMTCDPPAQDDVRVQDVTSSDTLYTIAPAGQSSGVHLLDPAWFMGPSKVRVQADAATTDRILLFGIEEAAVGLGVDLTLSGTSTVATTETWSSLRAIPAGYLDAARTVRATGLFVDPSASVVLDSSSAGDVQGARVFVLLRDGTAAIHKTTLTGTSAVTVPNSDDNYHILGVHLQEPAVGTVTVTLDSTPPITIAEFAPGESTKGVDLRRIQSVGGVSAILSSLPSPTPRVVAVFGRTENGTVEIEPLVLDGTDLVLGDFGWREVQGVATGNIPSTEYVRIFGHAWRFRSARGAVSGLSGSTGWTALGPGTVALDGVLAAVEDIDATIAPVELDGAWSTTEDTSISTLDADTLEITTPALAGSFSPPTVMRLKEPA